MTEYILVQKIKDTVEEYNTFQIKSNINDAILDKSKQIMYK